MSLFLLADIPYRSFAGIDVKAGSFQVARCQYVTKANILITGKDARRLYKTLERVPEVEEPNHWIKRTNSIECSVSKYDETYECSLTMDDLGEMRGPQRALRQPQQLPDDSWVPEQRPGLQHPQEVPQQQQQQCALAEILFD